MAFEKNIIWNFFYVLYLKWLLKRNKEKQKIKVVSLKLSGQRLLRLFKTEMVIRHVLFVRKKSHITRNQIWRDALHLNTHHLAINILLVMQGKK